MTWTGWSLMPPFAFTHAAQAGPTVSAWLLLGAWEPVSEEMMPILMGEPLGAGLVDPSAAGLVLLAGPAPPPPLLLQPATSAATTAVSPAAQAHRRLVVVFTGPWLPCVAHSVSA